MPSALGSGTKSKSGTSTVLNSVNDNITKCNKNLVDLLRNSELHNQNIGKIKKHKNAEAHKYTNCCYTNADQFLNKIFEIQSMLMEILSGIIGEALIAPTCFLFMNWSRQFVTLLFVFYYHRHISLLVNMELSFYKMLKMSY